MKVILHLHPREAISVWDPTFTSDCGLWFYLTYILLLFWGRCVSKRLFSAVPEETVICACVFLALRWWFMALFDASSASVNGCWHTTASHGYLPTKWFRVYVQTRVREQCLASGVSKKKPLKQTQKPSETIQWQSHELELFIVINRLN